MGQGRGANDDRGRAAAGRPPSALSASAPSDPAGVAAALVERLAAFLKASFLYPPGNQRVRLLADALLTALRAQLDAQPVVELAVGSQDIVVDGVRVPIRTPAQAWLRDLLIHAHVGGFEFAPRIDDAGLAAIAAALRKVQPGRDAWPFQTGEPIPGVAVRELVMTGGHADEAGEGRWVAGASSERSYTLAAQLAHSAAVRARVEELQQLLAASPGARGGARLDVIAELVRCLPAEAREDLAYGERLAESILASTCAELRAVAGAASRRDNLAPLLLAVGRKLFASASRSSSAPPPSAEGRGHGDDRITDDLGEMLAELEQLRLATADGAPPALDPSPAEVVGSILHSTVSGEVGRVGMRARALVAEAVAGGDRAARACLRRYFERAFAAEEADRDPAWRVVAFAADPRVLAALRETELLEPEQVAPRFPRAFGLFLDTLEGEGAALRLQQVRGLLHEHQLASCGAWFDRHPEELSEARVDRLFAAMSPAALPLAAIAIRHARHEVKPQAAKLLRQLALPGAASVALRVIDPPTRLPREYLEQLCTRGRQRSRRRRPRVTVRQPDAQLHQLARRPAGARGAARVRDPRAARAAGHRDARPAEGDPRRAHRLAAPQAREQGSARGRARDAGRARRPERTMNATTVDPWGAVQELVDELVSALLNSRVYFPAHPRVHLSIERFAAAIANLAGMRHGSSAIRLAVAGGYVVFEGKPVVGASLAGGRLIQLLGKIGSGGIELSPRAGAEEVRALVDVLGARALEAGSWRRLDAELEQRTQGRIRLLPPFHAGDDGSGVRAGAVSAAKDVAPLGAADGAVLELPAALYQSVLGTLQDVTVIACQGGTIPLASVQTEAERLLRELDNAAGPMMSVAAQHEYDAFTLGHSMRVTVLAMDFARGLGGDTAACMRVGVAGLLHDVGKAQVPFEILHSRRALTPEERAVIAGHPEHGARILLDHEGADPAAIVAAFGHHLRADRQGYPRTMHEHDMSVTTRIVQICDVYEALTAARPYKAPMSAVRAYRIMMSMRGHFDPVLLHRFIHRNGVYANGSSVVLSSGERALVLQQTAQLLLPRVLVTTDRDGNELPWEERRTIDLSDPAVGLSVAAAIPPEGHVAQPDKPPEPQPQPQVGCCGTPSGHGG